MTPVQKAVPHVVLARKQHSACTAGAGEASNRSLMRNPAAQAAEKRCRRGFGMKGRGPVKSNEKVIHAPVLAIVERKRYNGSDVQKNH